NKRQERSEIEIKQRKKRMKQALGELWNCTRNSTENEKRINRMEEWIGDDPSNYFTYYLTYMTRSACFYPFLDHDLALKQQSLLTEHMVIVTLSQVPQHIKIYSATGNADLELNTNL